MKTRERNTSNKLLVHSGLQSNERLLSTRCWTDATIDFGRDAAIIRQRRLIDHLRYAEYNCLLDGDYITNFVLKNH